MNPHIAVVSSIGLIAASAWSQSLNVEFGPASGAAPATYGAAGLSGTWNNIEIPFPDDWPPPTVQGPFALVGLDGRPVNAALRAINTVATIDIGVPANGPDGGDAALLGAGLIGYSPDIAQTLRFTGVANGQYRLITYTWDWQAQLYGMAAFIEGEPAIPVAGPWTGSLALGVTHMEHIIDVVAGVLEFDIVGAGPGSFFNGNNIIQGVQLWKLDEPALCPADLSGDGNVGGEDLGSLLLAWGECPRGAVCPADLTGDSAVDGADLGELLLAWGECANQPATCGDATLGDCYAVHSGGGCDDPACCAAVCDVDPYCCATAWDGLCVGIANLDVGCAAGIHPHCGDPNGNACLSAGGTPGCADAACCDAVCAEDPYCCTFAWDQVCADSAARTCD